MDRNIRMSQFYSPLINENGNFLSIDEIEYKHLSQLADRGIQEGYKVEYKKQWDDNFKIKHLCQTITSFANSEGGWLFIGINDRGTIVNIHEEKADFSQTIANKIQSDVSPTPVFECRFIRNPSEMETGVLVIFVDEGIDPPYICKGTVYIRSGSSKLPVAPDRSTIDRLIEKQNKYKNEMEKFKIDTIYASGNTTPFCMISLYNKKQQYQLTFKDFEDIKSHFNNNSGFTRSMLSHNSIIFFGSEIIGPKAITSTLEIFLNGSAKYSFYLLPCEKEICDNISLNLRKCNQNYDLTGFKFLDFALTFHQITETLNRVFKYFLTKHFDKNEYILSFNYRNIRNCLLYFDTGDNAFYDLVTRHGICYSIKKELEIIFKDPFKYASEDEPIPIFSWIIYGLCVPFGYFPEMLGDVLIPSVIKFNQDHPGSTLISRENHWDN